MASGKDGLHDDNIGPSMYAKSQGRPVKIWGLFGNGGLEYYVLPIDKSTKKRRGGKRRKQFGTTNMTGARYNRLLKQHFPTWRRKLFGQKKGVRLVQDHEKCLWMDHNLEAIDAAGFRLVDNHPKHSPDLNAIEGWWARLRQRLDDTAPEAVETRKEFLARLRRTVRWMNANWRDDALHLATNQKERARAVLSRAVDGARTRW